MWVKVKMIVIVVVYVLLMGVEIKFESGGYLVMVLIVGNCVILIVLNGVNVDLGLFEMFLFDLLKCGVGDILFVVNDVSGLVGLGLVSKGDYVLGEMVDLVSMKCQVKWVVILMMWLGGEWW